MSRYLLRGFQGNDLSDMKIMRVYIYNYPDKAGVELWGAMGWATPITKILKTKQNKKVMIMRFYIYNYPCKSGADFRGTLAEQSQLKKSHKTKNKTNQINKEKIMIHNTLYRILTSEQHEAIDYSGELRKVKRVHAPEG